MNKILRILSVVFLVILLGLNYVKHNYPEIMGTIAIKSFQKGDYQKALDCAEYALSNGFYDADLRSKYVEVLLDKELNVETQEKLYKILQSDKSDVAKAKVEQAFYKLRREIFNKYPDNYISKAPINEKIMRWGEMPITYNFYYDKDAEIPEYYNTEIVKAFDEWSKATNGNLIFEQSFKNPNIIIYYLKINPADEDAKKYVLAYTKPQIVGNKLEYSQINFYINDIEGKTFSRNQVYNTALHEIAHALGIMGHSSDSRNILFMSSKPKTVIFDKRESLSDADVATMNLLYDIKPDVTNVKAGGKYIPNVVLGDNEDISVSKIKEAEFYIKKAPKLPAGYIDLAEGYALMGEYKKAISALKKAMNYADNEDIKSIINYNLAISYYQTKNYDKALEYLDLASAYKSDETLAPLKMLIFKEMKNEIMMIELLSQNPNNIEFVITLMNYYIEQKQPFKARKVLKGFIENNPAEKYNSRFKSYGWVSMFL